MSEQSSRFAQGGDNVGMTDAQFKTYLLEQLENWKQVKKLAAEINDTKVIEKADEQIEKINMALKF